MELKEAFTQSVLEVCYLYKMPSQFNPDAEINLLSDTKQVNVMISFIHSQKGKVLFEFNQDAALKIASVLLDQKINSFDFSIKKSICEFLTFITRLAIGKMKVSSSIYFSDPILVTGNNVFALLSRSKANKLAFQINEDLMILTYYIE